MLRATADEEHDRHDDNPLRLEHALGREWNVDDTKRVFMRMNEEIQEHGGVPFAQSLTKHQRDALLHREICEDIEDFMAAASLEANGTTTSTWTSCSVTFFRKLKKCRGGFYWGTCKVGFVGETKSGKRCAQCAKMNCTWRTRGLGHLNAGMSFILSVLHPGCNNLLYAPFADRLTH